MPATRTGKVTTKRMGPTIESISALELIGEDPVGHQTLAASSSIVEAWMGLARMSILPAEL